MYYYIITERETKRRAKLYDEFKRVCKKSIGKWEVYNDSEDVWATLDGIQYTITIHDVLGREEEEPFESSCALENNPNHPAWEMLYEQYASENTEDEENAFFVKKWWKANNSVKHDTFRFGTFEEAKRYFYDYKLTSDSITLTLCKGDEIVRERKRDHVDIIVGDNAIGREII